MADNCPVPKVVRVSTTSGNDTHGQAGPQEVCFSILGPLEVTVGGRVIHLGGPRARGTLAALLLAESRIVPAERLVDQVWGQDPPPSVRNQVIIAVSVLRRALHAAGAEPGLIETVEAGYRLRAPHLDARQVEADLALARQAPPQQAAALMRGALDLWRGRVLAGIDGPGLRAAAEHWEELRLTTLEDWADNELQLGRHQDAARELGPLVEEHPLRERARALFMVALHRSGRQAAALEVYEQGRAVLVEELGLEPGQALRETHRAILRDDATVRQAGVRTRPAQLPPPVSSFVGRRAELKLLDALLDRDDADRQVPMCVLYGTAGVGKSGLAVWWAHQVAHRFPDGQLFVNLRGHDGQAPPLRPEAVLARFLRALGALGEQVPPGLDERTALFRSLLQDRRVLIVLDNAASTAQVRPLLPGARSCCVVVTSRSPLGGLVALDGASSMAVGVLSTTEAEELLACMVGHERIERERLAARRIGALCDRMPLPLRIVAAKLMSRSTWTVERMAGRLESEQGRLDELTQDEVGVRGTFALSYRGLSPSAKLAFRRLGLLDLPAGFDAWTVAALTDTPLPAAARVCEQLVDAQLVQPLDQDAGSQPWYGLRDLVRLFAWERAQEEETAESAAQAVSRSK